MGMNRTSAWLGRMRVRAVFQKAERIYSSVDGSCCASVDALRKAESRQEADLENLSQASQSSQESNLSQLSQSGSDWSDLERELFEERAAIIEFESGTTRRRAEFLAGAYFSRTRQRGTHAQ